MQTDLTPDRVRTVIAAAETVARRLEWRLGLPRGEHEDLRQVLLIDILRRLPGYDPERGSFEAFTQLVLTHCAARTASRIGAERRARGGALLSLDLPLDDDPQPLRDRIAEREGLWAWLGHTDPAEAGIDNAHDICRVLDLLPETDRQLCRGLMEHTAAALARAGHGSRSGLYRRLGDLRHVLTAHGLGPAWDDLAAA